MESKQNYLEWAREVIQTEAACLQEVSEALDEGFFQAAEAILACKGRIVVMGIGKSGHISRKIAATLASTGTPAFFVHPVEAAHGDLGMIVDGDVVVAISNSGESDEISALLPALKRKKITLICMTARPRSTLARNADIHIRVSVSKEACPLGLAPTSSSTATLVVGDALAVVLLRARSFTPDDFAMSHPAGSLGKRLLLRVADVMRQGDQLPLAGPESSIRDGILIMSEKGLGALIVVDKQNKLLGILTDGDLRRLFEKYDKVVGMTVGEVMHLNPQTIVANKLATEALKRMETHHISSLLVTDETDGLIGVVTMLDLLNARIV